MDIQKMMEKDNKSDGVYLYIEKLQFIAYGFSAYVLTQLFPELTFADKLYQEGNILVPYVIVTPKFITENFPEWLVSTEDKYIKVYPKEWNQSNLQQWRKGYDEYIIEQQKANNRLGTCVLGFFRLG